jgi:hypothetical protein
MFLEAFESLGRHHDFVGRIDTQDDGSFEITLSESSTNMVDYYGEYGGHSECTVHAQTTEHAPTLSSARAVALRYVGERFDYRTPYGIKPPPAHLPR